ncbi:MAG: BrnT family toxin [Spirochaetaceae bacterium]|nr:MAG: BrnT family toxin [Spirochaetaceae bacterium]
MNQKKDGVRFSNAETVLFDTSALTREDIESESAQSFVTVGMDSGGRILVVVYTYRGEDIRLISTRSATKRERMQYEEGI